MPKLDTGKHEKGIRLSFMVRDMADPVAELLELLSGAKLNVSRIMASRREDGISYVLAEIADDHMPGLLFTGEIGAKIIATRCIEK